ncbi:trypsin-like serine protease [Streptomyces sp. NPDC051704]|uniref:trypsin-like serine protease n=1 Tax=Streptomyces sp. NPDC051704 TaxID=3365671 RepID=UPI003788B34B
MLDMRHRRSVRTTRTALVATAAVAATFLPAGGAGAVAGTPATGGQYAHTARLAVGEGDDRRGCSAVLVAAQWLLTAESCFAAKAGGHVGAGKPSLKATATLGANTLEVTELAPRTDRDLVLAKLARPVTDIAPAKLAAAAPAQGTVVTAAGFGRTKTEWVPGKVHTGAFDATAVGATTLSLRGKGAGGDTVCEGDAGGPAVNGSGELVAVNSRSWQAGCLGTPAAENRRDAVAVRTDDLGAWVRQTTKVTPNTAGGQQITVTAVGTSTYLDAMASDGGLNQTIGDYAAGVWTPQWSRVDGAGMTALTSATVDNVVRVFGIGPGGKVFGKDFHPATGRWGAWNEVPGDAEGATALTASVTGRTVHLQIIGSDRAMYTIDGNYATGQWTPTWTKMGGTGLTGLTSTTANNVVYVYAAGPGGRVLGIDADYNTGRWSTWSEVPGGAAGVKGLSATATGRTVHLQIIGSDDALYTTDGDYNQGRWTGTWTRINGKPITSVTSAVVNNVVHIHAIGADGRVWGIDADYNTGRWGQTWLEVPGTVGS